MTGTELYKWDGINNPEKVIDLNSSMQYQFSSEPTGLSAVDGKLYFCAFTDALNYDFLVYDPSTTLTQRVKDADPGFAIPDNLLYLDYMSAIGNSLYFSTYYQNGDQQIQVYKYTPSTKSLTRTGEIGTYYSAYGYKQLGGLIYFINYTHDGRELWAWDGIHQAYRVNQLTDILWFEEYNGMLYFMAKQYSNLPKALFRYNPVNQKTEIIEMPADFTGGVESTMLKSYAGKIFFYAGNAIWSYDGINKPSIAYKGDVTYGYEMCVSGGILYLNGSDRINGQELYAYYEAPASVSTIQQKIISIYPNPTTCSWNFDLSSLKENDLQLIITDVTGRIVSKQQINVERKITLVAPAPGNYVYYISDANGNALQTGKLQRL